MTGAMSENQRMLTRYLAAVGCTRLAVFIIVTELWDKDATLEMLEYCASNPNATQKQLLEASSEIAFKIKRTKRR